MQEEALGEQSRESPDPQCLQAKQNRSEAYDKGAPDVRTYWTLQAECCQLLLAATCNEARALEAWRQNKLRGGVRIGRWPSEAEHPQRGGELSKLGGTGCRAVSGLGVGFKSWASVAESFPSLTEEWVEERQDQELGFKTWASVAESSRSLAVVEERWCNTQGIQGKGQAFRKNGS